MPNKKSCNTNDTLSSIYKIYTDRKFIHDIIWNYATNNKIKLLLRQ